MENFKLLCLTSNTEGGNSHADFKLSLHGLDLHRVKKAVLVSCVIRNDEYNINSKNNTLTYSLDAVQNTITIPVGQYTTSTLITAIETLEAGLTITQDTTTGKLTFDGGVATVGIDSSSTLAPYLGFTSDPTPATSVEAQTLPNLNGLETLLLSSHALAPHGSISSETKSIGNVFSIIPVDVGFGLYQTFLETSRNEGATILYQTPRDLTTIDIKILDQNEQAAELQSAVKIILKIYH